MLSIKILHTFKLLSRAAIDWGIRSYVTSASLLTKAPGELTRDSTFLFKGSMEPKNEIAIPPAAMNVTASIVNDRDCAS